MTKKQKAYTLSMPTIGVYADSAFSGIEVKRIDDSGDYVLYVELRGDKKTCHCKKIYYNQKGNPFINYCGRRVYFDEIIRV